jgi:endonuclease/exonuclease/phosphatase family metal-dependent hydrolase
VPALPLQLVTWNVRYFAHGSRGLRASPAGFTAVAEALAGLSPLPDIIALQEVEATSWRAGSDERPQLERLLTALASAIPSRRYRSLYFPAHRYAAGGRALYTTGLAILVAAPLEIEAHNALAPHDVTHRRLSWGARFKQTRVCAHARIAVPAAPSLDLFNTHLSLPAFLTADLPRLPARMGFGPNQLAEAEALRAFVEERAGSHAVVVGDLNSLPDSPAYRAVLACRGLTDGFLSAASPAQRGAWPTAGFLRYRMHLDHVFSSPGVQWLDFDQCHAYGEPGRFAGVSDHVPKVGRLVLA